MVEARGSEIASQVVGEARIVAEHDALDDPEPLSVQATSGRPPEPRAELVGEAGHATPAADHAPPVAAQDDVHSLTTEPAGLVEPVHGPTWADELAEDLEPGALRRRPSERQLEKHRLVDPQPPEPRDAGREAKLEAPSSGRPGDGDEARLRPPDAVREDAPVEVGGPAAPPPDSCEDGGCDDEELRAFALDEGRAGRGEGRRDGESRPRAAHDQRGCEAERRGGGNALGDERRPRRDAQGATRSRSWSRRAGPIPGTASSSSTELNAPCFWR